MTVVPELAHRIERALERLLPPRRANLESQVVAVRPSGDDFEVALPKECFQMIAKHGA